MRDSDWCCQPQGPSSDSDWCCRTLGQRFLPAKTTTGVVVARRKRLSSCGCGVARNRLSPFSHLLPPTPPTPSRLRHFNTLAQACGAPPRTHLNVCGLGIKICIRNFHHLGLQASRSDRLRRSTAPVAVSATVTHSLKECARHQSPCYSECAIERRQLSFSCKSVPRRSSGPRATQDTKGMSCLLLWWSCLILWW